MPSADEFASRILGKWRGAVESIVATGRELAKAKDALRHGEYTRMVEEKLPFGLRTAERLIAIAKHPVLSSATHVSCLPPTWGTLYELSRLPDDVLERRIKDGSINPEIERHEIKALLPQSEPEPAPADQAADEATGAASDHTDAAGTDHDGGGGAEAEPTTDDWDESERRRTAELYALAPEHIAKIARVFEEFGGSRLPPNDPRLRPWQDAVASLRTLTYRDVDQLITLLGQLTGTDDEYEKFDDVVLSLCGDPRAREDRDSARSSPKRQAKLRAEFENALESQWEKATPAGRRAFGRAYGTGTWMSAPVATLEAFVDRHRDELDPGKAVPMDESRLKLVRP